MGKPRTGKTTLVKKIVSQLKTPCGGFYTEEIIRGEKRVGFRIKTVDGKKGILAMHNLRSEFRLGHYGINIKDLEKIAVKAVEEALENKQIIVIDEIGKMELVSQKFKDVVLRTLNSGKKVIGVIHSAPHEFLNSIRGRSDVEILEVEIGNHEEVLKRVSILLQEFSKNNMI